MNDFDLMAHQGLGDPDPIETLRVAFRLPTTARLGQALHFSTEQLASIIVLKVSVEMLVALIQIERVSRLTTLQWAFLACAWSEGSTVACASQPVVFDGALWMRFDLKPCANSSQWVPRLERYLAWTSQIRLMTLDRSPAVH